jgi:hypothetical protein
MSIYEVGGLLSNFPPTSTTMLPLMLLPVLAALLMFVIAGIGCYNPKAHQRAERRQLDWYPDHGLRRFLESRVERDRTADERQEGGGRSHA